MDYFWIVIIVISMAFQNVCKKQYTLICAQKPYWFSAVSSFAAMLFFLILSGFKPEFNSDLLPYSICFAVVFAAATVGSCQAIKYGSLSITMLVISYSLIIPTLHGIIMLDESLSVCGTIGIVLLMISLFLINIKKDAKAFSLKWVIYLIVAFVGNGMCSVFQKQQQTDFGGMFKSEFMMLALLISACILFTISVFSGEMKYKENPIGLAYGGFSGILGGLVNYLVMMLTGTLPNSILFPVISAGGIILGFLIAVFAYKERLNTVQIVGYTMGAISVVMLNI